jgi:undecaprenyl-diphosphatase
VALERTNPLHFLLSPPQALEYNRHTALEYNRHTALEYTVSDMANSPIDAVILGLVEGITEFLPVSSTGHLIVTKQVTGFVDPTDTYEIVIQTGAILAVIWYYRLDLLRQIRALPSSKPVQNLFWGVVIGFLPAALLGVLFGDLITQYLFSPLTVAISLILGGGVIWYVEAQKLTVRVRDLEQISLKEAVTIGFIQCIALIPGVSRSLASIFGGMYLGLDRKTAAQFSFYLGMPTLIGAGVYKLLKNPEAIAGFGALNLAIGLVVSFISALMAVTWLLRYISSNDFRGFAIYRVIAGAVILLLIAVGFLPI